MPPEKRRQRVGREDVQRDRPKLDDAAVKIAGGNRLARHDRFEGVAGDGRGRQFVGGIKERAAQSDAVIRVAHLGGRDGSDSAWRQHTANGVEYLALSVVGQFALQDARLRPSQFGGMTGCRGAGHLSE